MKRTLILICVWAVAHLGAAAESTDSTKSPTLYDGAQGDGKPESQGWTAQGGIDKDAKPMPKEGCIQIETPADTKDQNSVRYIRSDVHDHGDDYFWQARVATVEGSQPVTLCFDHPKWYDQIQVLPGDRTVFVRTQPDAKGEDWMRVECPEVNKDAPHWFRVEHHGARFDFLIDGKKLASGLSPYASGMRRAWIQAYPNGSTRVQWYGYEYGPLAPKPPSSEPPAR